MMMNPWHICIFFVTFTIPLIRYGKWYEIDWYLVCSFDQLSVKFIFLLGGVSAYSLSAIEENRSLYPIHTIQT